MGIKLFLLPALFIGFSVQISLSQTSNTKHLEGRNPEVMKQVQELEKKKSAGKIIQGSNPQVVNPNPTLVSKPKYTQTKKTKSPSSTAMAPDCDCWQERDGTWSVAAFDGTGASGGPGLPPEYRNDDWSTISIGIPFNFCFYGTPYNSLFINNNGNISFGSAYSTFTSNPFPDASFSMVAPFWGDVDTRNLASGIVYYKAFPDYIVVQWDSVGYFDQYADKLNTFQAVLSNGISTIIPDANNVSFCYKDMQWTTGDASGGSGGFGGTPATVGANKGDGASYVQFGRFDHAGTDSDGPAGVNDGVSWLDDQYIIFNTCAITNLPPSLAGLSICENDTIIACMNDTTTYSVSFFSPEVLQTTTTDATSSTLTGFSIVSNPPGNAPTIIIQITPNIADTGLHIITFTGVDNGLPALTTSANVVVKVVDAYPVDAGADQIICIGDSVQLSATSPISQYSWAPAATLSNDTIQNPWADPIVTTDYVVTVSDTIGCPGKDTVTVVVSQTFAGPDQTLCLGFTTTLNTCFPGTCNYSWAPATGLSATNICNPTANPTVTTTYTLTAEDCVLGCVTTDLITVTVVPELPADAGPAATICSADPFIMNATGGTVFNWNPPAGLSSTTIANPVCQPVSTTTYTVNISDATGCTGLDTVTIMVIPSPISEAGVNVSYCSGGSAVLNGSGNGTTFSWSPAAFLSSTAILNPVVSAPITDYYYLTMVAPNNCELTDSVLVTVQPLPLVSAGPDLSLCSGQGTTLGATSSPSGTYAWSPPGGLSSNTILNPFALPTSTVTYSLVVTDAFSCQSSDVVTVTVNPNPSVSAGPDQSVCVGNTAQLNASGSITTGFSWTPVSGLSNPGISNPVFSGATTQTYTIVLTDLNNCQSFDVLTVEVNPNPTLAGLTTKDQICGNADGAITLGITQSGTPPYTYSKDGVNYGAGGVFSGLLAGSYTIFIMDAKGCTYSIDTSLGLNNPVEASFTYDPSSGFAPLKVSFLNQSTGANHYLWNFGDSTDFSEETNPVHEYKTGGFWDATLIAYNNLPECADTAGGMIAAIDLFAPNIFTPFDKDGKNDTFVVRTDGLSMIKVTIFNRWGKTIKTWEDLKYGWDGTNNGGQPVEDGIYYYIVNGTGIDGQEYNQRGFVQIVGSK